MEAVISKRQVRRGFALAVFNAAAFDLAERLIDPPLVLTWFVGLGAGWIVKTAPNQTR